MGNKCCKSQSSTYSSVNPTIRSFSSYDSSIARTTGNHAITFGIPTRGNSLTTLTMKSSNNSDVGKDYRGGSSSTIGQEDSIPVFLRRLNDLNIRVGTRTRLLIELDNPSGVQVRWFHNNIEAESDRYQYIYEGGFYCLDIVPVTLEDEGLWVCSAQNYIGKSSTAAHLSLIVPKAFKKPIFVEQLRAVLTQRGIVSLECKVIGVPTPKLRWYKDDKEIKAGDIFALTANSNDECLGIYTCEATNVMGTALSTSKIQVTHTQFGEKCNVDSLIPYGPSPKFLKVLKNAFGKIGNSLFLECQVEVPPWPQSIGWYNDSGIINEGPLYHLISDGLGMYGIEIKSLRADHNTTWKCVATSSTGAKAITSCKVSVSYPKNYRVPRFLESLRAIMTDEGLVSFECKVIGYPTPQLLWFKDGTQLQPGDVYELTGSKSLGSYCCVAQNCMGEASSLAELTIEDIQNQLNESEKLQLTSNTQPPRFLLGLKSTETNINEPFVFMVKVTTESTPTITWYKEDVQLTESSRYQFSSEENSTFILNIVPVEMEDEAEWKCVAINKFGQTVTSSFLKLNIPKNFKLPRFLEELRIAFSNEGSVNLECKVIGVPQPQLKWFKDGQEINPGDMHKIISGKSGTCCLGTYTCQAHNCMGTVSSSATLLTMEDKSTVKSCASDEYLSVVNPLVRNESLSTIFEERTSQMEKSYTIEEPADISFSFDGKEVTVSLYETPDLTHDEALQIIEMYADELSEHISEDNIVDLPSLRIVKETSISGPVMMEALVIDVPTSICKKHTQSDTDFDGVSLTEDNTLANIDKSDSMCDNSLEYFSDHLSSSNSKRDIFYSASETTPKNVSLKQLSEDGGHLSFQTPNNFMLNSDDQILTQLNLEDKLKPQIVQNIIGSLVRSESNNTEEEVSEILAEVDDELPITQNYCPAEIVTNYEEDGLVVFDKIQNLTIEGFPDQIENLKVDSRSNIDEFLNNMKTILECSMIKMCKHESCNFKSTPTKLEQSIQSLHSLAWRFIEETNRNHLTEIDKNTANNVSILMTAINASLLALEQVDDPFGVSDNILNEIQSSVCFDFETLNNKELLATDILDRISDEIKNFITVVNRQVATVTEQRIIAVLRNTIGTTLIYIKQLQQSSYTIKCININSFAPLFSMVHPLESILNDIISLEEQLNEDSQSQINLKQMLIPPISSIAFYLDNLNTALKNEYSEGDQDLKDIFDRINDSNNQFKVLTSLGIERNNLAECFISFTKSINDLCCHLRRLGRSNENIVSSDYGSDDKLLLDFETLFDELMIDIDTLTNNVNVVRDSENNMNPLGPLLEPLQDIKIGLFQVNQVLLSNQTGSNMSYEVISCFEHLSQQLVQLNNCIVNQSIVEETNKELPFESSIKMMQNILFNDEIDDLGLNGILFGSVMKPLLQLQNIIVSKMAAVESDLSFSEQTDVTGDGCDTQSLSVSLTKNETVLNKIDNNLKQNVKISSKTDDISDVSEKDSNIIQPSTSKNNYDVVFLENSPKNNFVIKKGFECDIGLAFKDEEPNIITSEDDPENSGFDVLFEETDLETFSDFIEDEYVDNLVQSNVDNNLSSLSLIEVKNHDIENCYNTSKSPLELFDTCIQDNELLNSTIELPDKVEDSLNMIIEEELEKIKERNLLDDHVIYNDSQENDSKIIEIDINKSDEFLNINQIRHETNLTSKEYEKNNETLNDITEPVFEKIQNGTAEYVNSEKSEFIKRVNEIDEISDFSPDKTEEVNDLTNLKTPINTFEFISDDEINRKNENLLDNNDHTISSYIQNELSKNDERSNMVHDGNLEENTILLNLENKTLNSESINENNKKNISADIISLQNSESFVEKQNEYICVPNTSEIIVNEIVNYCDIKSLNIDTVNNVNDNFIDVELKCLKTIEPSQLINNPEEHFNMENEPTKSYSQNNSINEENNIKINTYMDETIKLLESNNIDKVDEKGNKIMILNDGCNSDLELNKNMESCVEYNNAIKNENDLVVEELNHLNIQEISNKMIINTPILENIINEDFQEISTNVSERIIDDFKESISSLDVNLAKVTENLILHEVIEEKNSIDENNIIMDSNNMNNEVEINKKLNMNNLHPANISKEVINTISLTDDESKYLSNLTAICDGTEELVSKSAVSENIIFNQNINNKQCETDNDHDLIQQIATNISDNLIISDNKEQNDESSDFNYKILTPAHIMNTDNLSNLQEDNLENSKQIQDDTIKNINQNEDSLNLQDTVDLIQNIDSKILDQQLINNNDDTKQMISNIKVEYVQINDEEKEFTNLDNNNIINEFEIDGGDETSKNITIELKAPEHLLDKKETDTDNNINIKIKDEFNFDVQCENEANDNINVGDLNKAILYENSIQINDMCDLILPIENENVEVKNLSLLIEENKAIINNEVITVENSQSFDLYKYDEKKVDVKYENENRDNIAFEQITIFNSPNNNLVNSETQQIISLMEGEIDSGIDEFSIIVDNINIDNNNLVNDDTSILEEKYKQIICNDDNQVDNTERLNKADIEIVEEKLENNLQCGKPQKIIILNDMVKIDENLMLTSNVGEDDSCNESLNKEAKNIKNLICKEDENNKKIIEMDENIDIKTTQSVCENLNVMISDNNEIIKNDSDVLIANDDITQESKESTLMIKPKESNDNSNDEMLINDNYNKLLINTEIENSIKEINSSGISCSYNDNNQIENNDIVIYNSTENNSSSTVENNLALNVTEILKTDCVQMIDHLKCTENILLDDANQNNNVTESALILKDMNTLENDYIKQMSNTINNDITYNEMDESDNITNKLIDRQNKEYNAIDNTEVLNSDNTEPLKKCDIIQESLNEKLTDQLNDSIEISTPNVFQSSISIHEVNSNEDQNEIINFNDIKSEDIINNTISNITDNSKNKIEPKNTENLINIEDHVLNNNDLDKNITNNEYNNLSHDQYLSTVNDIKNIDQNSIDNSNIINMENEITNIIDRNVINSEQLMYEDESKNEIREDQQEVENNKERDHKNKCHEQISISQNYFIPEDKIYDLPIKEIVNNISVIPKLHRVEHMTANKSENVMLENVNIWENDKNKVKNNIIEKAKIEHELNIAAIVNIVKDFDSIKENTVSSNVDKQNLLENAILTTIDKHTTDIMLKYVDILEAPSEDTILKEENVLTDEKQNEFTEKVNTNIMITSNEDILIKEKDIFIDDKLNDTREKENIDILKETNDSIKEQENVLSEEKLNKYTEKENNDILKASSKDIAINEENILTDEKLNDATEKESVDIFKAPSDDLIKKEKKVPTDENVNESTENLNVNILKASKEDIIIKEEDVLTDHKLNDSTEKVNIDILKVSNKDTTIKEENIITVEERNDATRKENVDILKAPSDDLIKKEKEVPTDENVNESTGNANVDILKASSEDLKKKKAPTDEKLNEFTDNMNEDILKAPNKNKIIKEENVLNDDKLECDTENKNVDILKETNVNEPLKSNIENEQFLNKEHNLVEVKNDNLILENIINEHEKDTIKENLSPEFDKCSNISKNKNIEEEKIDTKILKESILNDEDNSCELELEIREKKESNVENNVDALDNKLAIEISLINDHYTPKLIQNENNKCVVDDIEKIISNNNHLVSDKINNKIESISKKEDSEKIKKNRGSKKNKTNLQPQHEVLMSKEISSIQNNKNIEKNINSFENDTVSQYELLDEYKKDNKEMVNIKEKILIDPMEKIESTLNIININTIDDNNIENSEKNNINSSNLLQNEFVIDNVENNTPQQNITENKERKKNDAILKEHETQKEMKKRGSKKKRTNLQDKKSPSPDKSINISSDKNNEIDYQIKKNENTNMIEDTIFNKNVFDEIKEENNDKQIIVQKPIITQNENPNFILHESLVCVNKNNNNIWTNEKDISNVSHINIKNEHLISSDVFVDKVTKATDRKVLYFSDFKSNSKTLPSISIIKPMKSDYDFDRHQSTRYLDVTDAYRSHTKPLTSRSLTPEPRRISESIKYSYSSDRDINRHCGSGRSLSPYPEPSVRQNIDLYSTRNRWLATYRSSCRLEDENLSYTSYGAMKRRGSDSFLHDSGARNNAYYSSRRFPENVSSFSSATCIDDLTHTKEIFKRLSFCVRLMDQTVSSGTRVKFWCSIIGYPEPRVQWYRDGQRLNSFAHNSSTRYQSRYINGLAQLIVENAQSCDSGEYTCVATNSRDRISTTGYLTVYTSPLVFGATPNRRCLSSMEGLKHSALTDRPYLWTNNDNLRSNFTYKYNNNDWRLSENISSRCPRYPKFVTSIIADDIATYGGTIALQVRIQGSPLPNVTWLRETNPLPRSSNKYIYLDEGGLFTLLVKDSTNKDSGTYVCRACNLYGTADVEKSVRVVSLHDYSERRGVKPAIIVSRPNDRLNVAVGEDITVTLRVAGEPKPKVIWMKGSRDVTFIDRSLKETVNDYVKLSIKKAQLSDAGTYFIIAKNVYGSDRAFVTVGVSDRIRISPIK